MIAARLKQCLAVLRWRDIDLADASGRAISDVRAWLDGRQRPPLSVAAWLEALAMAHRSVPPLRSATSISEKQIRAGDAFQIAGPTTQERRNPVEHEVFEHPVTIIVGLGLPRQVNTVLEAYAILNEWPPSGRSTAHAMALKACKAALAGEIEAETARGMFFAFAQRNDLLAPRLDEVVAAETLGAFGASASN
jgi:hypothetical protein